MGILKFHCYFDVVGTQRKKLHKNIVQQYFRYWNCNVGWMLSNVDEKLFCVSLIIELTLILARALPRYIRLLLFLEIASH